MVHAPDSVTTRTDKTSPAPLFLHAGIHLPLKTRPYLQLQQIWNSISDLYCTKNVDIGSNNYLLTGTPINIQYHFDFMDRSATEPIYFVPRSHHLMLHYGVYDVLQDRPLLRQCGLKLEGKGILYLAHLVQLTKAELLQFKFINTETVALIETELATFGLRLGSVTPSWRGPQPSRVVKNRAAIGRSPTI